MKRDKRFPVVLSKTERTVLRLLAELERISAAAVVRRLIWREAEERGLLAGADDLLDRDPVSQEAQGVEGTGGGL